MFGTHLALRLGMSNATTNKGVPTMKTLCILFLAFILNGIGAYVAYRLVTWFETGRPHIEPQPRQNVRKEVKP